MSGWGEHGLGRNIGEIRTKAEDFLAKIDGIVERPYQAAGLAGRLGGYRAGGHDLGVVAEESFRRRDRSQRRCVRDMALPLGLVDVKVCAIDDV